MELIGSDLRNLLSGVDRVGPTQLIESLPILVNSSQYLVLKAEITLDKTALRKKHATSGTSYKTAN